MLNVPPGAVVSFKVAVKDGNANSAGAAIVQELNIINSNGQSLPRNDPLKNNLGGKLWINFDVWIQHCIVKYDKD